MLLLLQVNSFPMNQGVISRKFFSVKNVPRDECNFIMDEENEQECLLVLDKMAVRFDMTA